jgi:aerobic carbon-monoxide dehydrogenase medium subunit
VSTEYRDPERLGEVLDLLREFGDDAKLVAGGQSLMVMRRQGLIAPSLWVDLSRVEGLAGITQTPGDVRLGAMTTIRTIERDPVISAMAPLLARAAAAVGPLQVRNMATIGGSIAHNAPGADSPPALLALDAAATVAGVGGNRSIALEDFFTGYFETALRPDEVLTEFRIPTLPVSARARYLKFAPRAVDMAVVGVAVILHRDADRVLDVRIAIGGAAAVPFRAREAEAHLREATWSERALSEAGRLAARAASPASDLHASADYRRWLIRTLVPRALASVADGNGVERTP